MILRRVQLENIMSHENTVVEFERGVNAIVGPNGSGKSAIIDAIVYALIGGCVRGEEAVRAELSSIVRVGARRASISVEFEIGGKCYRVERGITLAGGEAQSQFILRECSGQLVAHGRDSFCEKMSELLGLKNLKALPHTLVARQGHLSDFILGEPSRRAETVLDLLGLAWLDKAKESLGRALRSLEVEVGVLSREEERLKSLEAELEKLKRRVEEVRAEERKLEAEVRELESRVESTRRELADLKNLWVSAEKLKHYERVKRELRELEMEVEELKKGVERLSPYVEAEEVVREGIMYVHLANEELKRAREEARKLEEKLKSVLGNASLDDLKAEAENARRAEEEAIQRYRELVAEEKIIMTALQAGISGDRCPLCGSPLDDARKSHMIELHATRLLELRESIPRAKREAEEATARRKSLEAAVRAAEEALRELEKAKARIESEQLKVSDFLKKYNEIAEKLGLPRAERFEDCKLREIAGAIGELRRLERDLERRTGALEALRAELSRYDREEMERTSEELKKRGLTIEAVEKSYRELDIAYHDLLADLEDRKEKLSKLRGELSALLSQISAREAEIAKTREALKTLEVKKRALKIADKLYSEYLGRSGYLSKKALEDFRERFSAIVNDIMARLGRDFSIDLGEDMEIRVGRDGQMLSINSLSGGERTMLAIVSRIALASMISGKRVSVLILDEPTEYLDAEARKTVFYTIRDVASYIDQIIVVTHDPEVEDIADVLIHVEKRGGVSRVAVERITSTTRRES